MKRSALLLLAAALAVAGAGADEVPLVPTVITSQAAEARTVGTVTTFIFTGLVTVTGTDLKLTCDRLVVLSESAGPAAKPKPPAPTVLNQSGRFKHLDATGRVRIVQGERVATCEHAEVFPDKDEVVLTGKPMVEDPELGTATAHLIRLKRGERSVFLEPGPDGQPQIVTRPMQPLGYSAGGPAKKDATAPAPARIQPKDSTAPAAGADRPKKP